MFSIKNCSIRRAKRGYTVPPYPRPSIQNGCGKSCPHRGTLLWHRNAKNSRKLWFPVETERDHHQRRKPYGILFGQALQFHVKTITFCIGWWQERYKSMTKKCAMCGLDWIVSVQTKIPKSGYECPHCESKRRNGFPFPKREERKERTSSASYGK